MYKQILLTGKGSDTPDENNRDTNGLVDYAHSTVVGVFMGLIAGIAIGAGMIAFFDSPKFYHWSRAAVIVLCSAGGWGVYGMIVGGSGIFSEVWKKREPKENHRAADRFAGEEAHLPLRSI